MKFLFMELRKKTPWGVCPSHWEISKISNVATLVTDYVANGSFASLAENVHYKCTEDYAVLIRLVDYNNQFKKDFVFIDKNAYNFLSKSKLHGGEIIISNVGANVGTVFRCPKLKYKMSLAPNSIMVKFSDSDDFYYYWFNSPAGQFMLRTIITGSAQPKFNKTNFRDLLIPVPPIKEQQQIASILSSLDDKIELNHRINENLEQQAQALFKSWFVDFEPFKDGKFVDSELGMIPEGWKVGTIGDYSKIRSGFAFKSSWWTNKGVKIVKIKNISSSGNLDMNDCSYVSKENTLKAKEFSLKPGDLLIAMTGATIGKFCIVPILKEEMYVNQRVGKFFLGEEPILKVPFIYGLLKSENIISQIINKGQGSAQPNISANDIETISIILPPEDIISKYNELVSPYFSLLIKNLNECDYLANLRDTLLPKLMSGEIKLSEIETKLDE